MVYFIEKLTVSFGVAHKNIMRLIIVVDKINGHDDRIFLPDKSLYLLCVNLNGFSRRQNEDIPLGKLRAELGLQGEAHD